jgi:hypothetical protein
MNKQKLIELRCKAWGITEDEYYCNQCSDFSLEDMARAHRRGKNKGARDKAIQNVGFYQKQMQDIYDKKNKQIAELKAECDLAIEGRDVQIQELEARCNELFLQTCEQAELIEKMKCCGNCIHCKYDENEESYEYCEKHQQVVNIAIVPCSEYERR